MRIFVTGASGYVGHGVAKAFRAKGHRVYGLVRSEEKAAALRLEEIIPVIGNLENPDSYRSILNEIEVAVHCAFDFSTDKGVEKDAKTIDTILKAFSESSLPRTFIYTSGVWVYGSRGYEMVDEAIILKPLEIVKWRPGHEEKVLKATSLKLRTVIMRPGFVYGCSGGLTDTLFASTSDGEVTIVGEGHNRWPMVHLKDLAHAYVSAAEKEVTGVIFNVVDDSTATLREMAEAIARESGLNGKIKSLSLQEARRKFGSLADGFAIDLTVNNSRIKRLLGWQIHHAPFNYEIDIYFTAWRASQIHGRELIGV